MILVDTSVLIHFFKGLESEGSKNLEWFWKEGFRLESIR